MLTVWMATHVNLTQHFIARKYAAMVKTLQTVTNKPYVNEVSLTGQNQALKYC